MFSQLYSHKTHDSTLCVALFKLHSLLCYVDCGGGQEEWPCGKPCPRSCSDLYGDTECLDSPGCRQTCGCPGDLVLQDGVCVAREECRCKYQNSSATGEIHNLFV